jgi:hypothetical protein
MKIIKSHNHFKKIIEFKFYSNLIKKKIIIENINNKNNLNNKKNNNNLNNKINNNLNNNKLNNNKNIGIEFENETIKILKNYNFNIKNTKSSYDHGIDFYGDWELEKNYKILGQCKKEKKNIGEKYIRELLGVINNFKKYENNNLFIGIFVSDSNYTKNALSLLKQTNIPLIFIKIDENKIVYLLMNDTAKKYLSLNIGIFYNNENKKILYIYKRINGEIKNIVNIN